MKPLELTVYPRLKRPRYGHQIDDYRKQWKREQSTIKAKRFTDAELAAEYWASHGEANALMTGNPRLLFSRRATLGRFAKLPHYNEVQP